MIEFDDEQNCENNNQGIESFNAVISTFTIHILLCL